MDEATRQRKQAELIAFQDEEAQVARRGETEKNRERLLAIRARIGQLLQDLGKEEPDGG
jgi:hypothetical protein